MLCCIIDREFIGAFTVLRALDTSVVEFGILQEPVHCGQCFFIFSLPCKIDRIGEIIDLEITAVFLFCFFIQLNRLVIFL